MALLGTAHVTMELTTAVGQLRNCSTKVWRVKSQDMRWCQAAYTKVSKMPPLLWNYSASQTLAKSCPHRPTLNESDRNESSDDPRIALRFILPFSWTTLPTFCWDGWWILTSSNSHFAILSVPFQQHFLTSCNINRLWIFQVFKFSFPFD